MYPSKTWQMIAWVWESERMGTRERRGTEVVCGVRARQQFHRTPQLATVDRGEKTGMRANSLTRHTHELSYVAHKNSLFMPRFVQKALDGDEGVWASWLTTTRVGVSVFVFFNPDARVQYNLLF